MSVCKSCGAEITWHRTPAGRLMPLDAEPVEGGNIRVDDEDVARVTEPGLSLLAEPLYVSHFSTCPDADKFRKKETSK